MRPTKSNFPQLFKIYEKEFFANNEMTSRPDLFSREKFNWACPNGESHLTHRTIYEKLWHPKRCTVCSGFEILKGVNDLESQRKDIAEQLVDKNIDASEIFWKTTKIFEWECPSCGCKWKTSARNRTRSRGNTCGICSGKIIKENINNLETFYPWLKDYYSDLNKKSLSKVLITDKEKYLWKCPNGFPHLQHRRVDTFLKYPKSCSVCSNKEVVTEINDVYSTDRELIDEFFVGNPKEKELLKAVHRNNRKILFSFKCRNGHYFKKTLKDFFYSPHSCSQCYQSSLELLVAGFLKSLLEELNIETEIVLNDREVLKGKEIDIFLPVLRIGFEVNGEYWHSELVDKDSREKHVEKIDLAKESGLRIFFIWEDDFLNNHALLKEEIERVLGKSSISESSHLLRLESNINRESRKKKTKKVV